VLDRVLVQRFNGGDEAAFVEIVTRYRTMIMGQALRFMRNHADAEEIAQDTFIRAHRGLARFRGESSLATWLHRIAFNLARNRYWHFFRRRRHMTVSLDSPLGPESAATFAELVAGQDAGPARQATVDEFVAVIAACMKKLDDPHREILTLRNLMHNSYEEIARALGTNQGTVKSRIARARGKLRDLMVEMCPEFPVNAAPAVWFEHLRHSARVA
jgi:RNA polymerase sigma-70 factor (ECF subfamily)